MNQRPLLTVCIPAYNRAHLLAPLLQSIFMQNFKNFNVLICEDLSPDRSKIASIVAEFVIRYPGKITYEENFENLGYDGNIRKLVDLSTGEYCLFMGNDDLMCVNSMNTLADIISRNNKCGVVIRSYATFDKDPDKYEQVYRYYPNEITLPPGANAIIAAFRRSVVIPGMVIHRDSAHKLATNKFDGTLLYQLYLVGMILSKSSVIFTPEIIALRRNGTLPDFGNSNAEKGKFTPKDQTTDSSLHFMTGMFKIAKDLEEKTGLNIFSSIRADIGAYSYPILSIQASKPKIVFIRYCFQLAKMEFWRSTYFYFYFILLLVLGPSCVDKIICFIKTRLGYTPSLGVQRGER